MKYRLRFLAAVVGYGLLFQKADADIKSIYRESKNSVVAVIGYLADGKPGMIGTGFFVGDGSVIATSCHVIQRASSVRVKLHNDTYLAITNMIAVDRDNDLVLLDSPAKGQPLRLASQDPEIGDKIITIGNPRGLEGSVSDGLVSGIRKSGDLRLYQITAPISPGSSGGPVISEKGEVVGVSACFLEDSQNLNFAVPSRFISTLLTRKTSRRLDQWLESAMPMSNRDIKGVKIGQASVDGIDGLLEATVINDSSQPFEKVRLLATFFLWEQTPPPEGFRLDVDPVHSVEFVVTGSFPVGRAKRIGFRTPSLLWHGPNTRGLRGHKGTWIAWVEIVSVD